jgi:hypothetical protein
MIYLLIVLYLLLLVYIFDYKKHKTRKDFWYAFTCLIFILLSGLRYRIGGDTLTYMNMYDDFPTLFTVDWNHFETKYQPLWNLFVLIHKTITPDFALLQFTHATILNVSIFAFIKKRTNNLFTFIYFYFILYYFALNFEALRESLAVAVFLYGFKYFENKKWIHYCLFAFISFGFHVSAVFLFFLPLFRNLKLTLTKVFVILLILILCVSVFYNFFVRAIYTIGLSGKLADNTYGYIEGIQNISFTWRFRLYVIGACVVIPFTILLLPKIVNITYKIKYSTLCFVFLFIGCFCLVSYIVQRFLNYIFVFYLLFLSDFIISLMKKYRKSSFLILLFITFLFRTDIFLFDQTTIYPQYFPYYTIITKQKDKNRERIVYPRHQDPLWKFKR